MTVCMCLCLRKNPSEAMEQPLNDPHTEAAEQTAEQPETLITPPLSVNLSNVTICRRKNQRRRFGLYGTPPANFNEEDQAIIQHFDFAHCHEDGIPQLEDKENLPAGGTADDGADSNTCGSKEVEYTALVDLSTDWLKWSCGMVTDTIHCAQQGRDMLGQEETGDCCTANCLQGETLSKTKAPASSAERLRSRITFGRTFGPRQSAKSSSRANQQKEPPYVSLALSCFAMSNQCLCWLRVQRRGDAQESPCFTLCTAAFVRRLKIKEQVQGKVVMCFVL